MTDLRISVTDRCNFRCTYCMPRDVFGPDYVFLPHREVLSYEEITQVARILTEFGVRKIRLTGGEPLLRRDLERLISALKLLPDVEVALTTNGSLLAKRAQGLKDAGLDRVTVSLDALDEPTFQKMNDADYPASRVIDGIAAAYAVGLGPVKINAVIQRGVNEHAILDLARYFKGTGHIVRFIEFMDVGSTNGWAMDQVVSKAQILEQIHKAFPLEASSPKHPEDVAQRWRYLDGEGEIGIISSVTAPFCGNCSRIRLSTDGQLFTCLFAREGHDIKHILRSEDTSNIESTLRTTLMTLWQGRQDRYSELRTEATAPLKKIEMSYIGG